MVTENGDIGIFKILFLEMNGQSGMSKSFKSCNNLSNFDILLWLHIWSKQLNSHYEMTKQVIRIDSFNPEFL